ncbi:MAG: hypothetical protein IKN07_01450 [Lachnospiraceae bacterium]|nr:hypothetical protein [Lachnospiraceae bacterium]MBR3734520.1 hypothetical protein [Lachnospiraceae bacterium]
MPDLDDEFFDNELNEELENRNDDQNHIFILGNAFAFDKFYFSDKETKEICKLIKPMDGFESIAIHGNADHFLFYFDENSYISVSPEELSNMLKREMEKEDPGYHGGNIRLLSCRTGEKDNGAAYQLAQLMEVDVLAPTMDLVVRDKTGELLITNDEAKIDRWLDMQNETSDGEWRIFHPKDKGEKHE